MVMMVYSIRDKVADDFGPLMCCKTDGVAVRAMRQAVGKGSLDDYQLWCVGRFDTETGELDAAPGREIHVLASEAEVS